MTKASLTWADTSFSNSSVETSRLDVAANSIGCMMPIKLISKHEIFFEDKLQSSKFLLAPEC